MSREEPDVASETKGLRRETADNRDSITDSSSELTAAAHTVYRGRRDPTAPVGDEVEVTVNGEPLDCRYDLLSASPAGFQFGHGGSGPAQLAIAMLADALGDEFACEHYQQFKREVVSKLPEQGWTLTKQDLNAWRREVIADA